MTHSHFRPGKGLGSFRKPPAHGIFPERHKDQHDKWIVRVTFAAEIALYAKDYDGSLAIYDSRAEAYEDGAVRFLRVLNTRVNVLPKNWARAEDVFKSMEAEYRNAGKKSHRRPTRQDAREAADSLFNL